MTAEKDDSGEWQREHVPNSPIHVRQPHRLLPLPGLVDHGRGDVDAGDVPGDTGHRTGDEAGAAGDIEHRVVGADSRRLDHQPIGVLVVVVRHLRERHRLLGELLHDQPPLFVVSLFMIAHLFLIPWLLVVQ